MKTFSDFLTWEARTRDTLDFKKIYIDMAGGDILAGLALSEIIFWHLPTPTGASKLRVERGDHWWIKSARYEWWDRCRMTPRQSDRALKILKEKELIITERFKWNNSPTVHIRINEENFLKLWIVCIETPAINPFLPNGEMGRSHQTVKTRILPNGEMELTKRGNLITETTDIEEKITTIAATPPAMPDYCADYDVPLAPPTIHGYRSGDLVWAWSDKQRKHVQVTVTRETEAFVWFVYVNGSGVASPEYKRGPKNIYREKPEFMTFEELTPEEQAIGKWCKMMRAGEGVPGATLTYIRTVLKACRGRFLDKMPSADEFERVFAWSKDRGDKQWKDPEKIPDLVGEYREAHRPKTAIKAPAPHETADPNCALCKGMGVVKASGALVSCDCTTLKAEAK